MTNLPANAHTPDAAPDPAAADPAPRAPRRSMREQWDDMVAKFMALPVRQRWLLGAVGVVLAGMAVNTLSWQVAAEWSEESDQIEAALARDAARAESVTTELRRNAATFGPVDVPVDAARGRQELARAINDVSKAHHFVCSYESRTGQRIKDADTATLGGNLERVQAEVKFDTTADELPKILLDFEMHPGVDCIRAIRLQKNDANRKITVQATLEAWVVGAGSRRSGS